MRTKADIQFHGDTSPRHSPVVNVKVRNTWQDGYRQFVKDNPDVDPEFTEEWIEEHISEDAMQTYWEFAIEQGWEQLESDAMEIYGRHIKVYSCGRQGGWAYITGPGFNPDTDSWDAIEFGKWRRFAKWAREQANGIMYLVIDGIYINRFDDWKDERSELRAPDLESVYAP